MAQVSDGKKAKQSQAGLAIDQLRWSKSGLKRVTQVVVLYHGSSKQRQKAVLEVLKVK